MNFINTELRIRESVGFQVKPVPEVDSDSLRNDLKHRENYVNQDIYRGNKIDIKA